MISIEGPKAKILAISSDSFGNHPNQFRISINSDLGKDLKLLHKSFAFIDEISVARIFSVQNATVATIKATNEYMKNEKRK